MALKHRLFSYVVVVAAALLTQPVGAAQMVALDMKAAGGVKKELAETLTHILLAELARRPGMSVISQTDVRALLEAESMRQELGCSEESCMAELAGSLGAELLVTSSVGRVGRKWVVSLTLIQVEQAKAVRRATGEQTGPEEVASEAVLSAVHKLFRDGLPEELMGPACMSRLGFRAALLGYSKVVRDPKEDPKPHRKRLVLDLVNTELDYDVTPKMDELDLTARRQIGALDMEMLGAKDKKDFARLFGARREWVVLRKDLERVKEIRVRARERGVVPSGRPLRFEAPEPPEWPEAKALSKYQRDLAAAHKVVAQALAAYLRDDEKGFAKYWAKDKQTEAQRALKSGRESDRRYGYTYKLVPAYAIPPWLLERAVESHAKGDVTVYMLQYRKGKAYDDEYAILIKENGRWRIRYW